MLFVAINRPELPQDASLVDGIEFRLDLFPHFDLNLVKTLLHQSPRPVMFTLRKASHGGKFDGSEEERLKLISQLSELHPAYFDLEWDTKANLPKNVKIIRSYHNFEETPDLGAIYRSMSAHPAFGYKIAAMAHSTNDALRMLLFAREHPGICVIPMGAKGAFARALGPVVGNLIDYASADDANQTAPGQISVAELLDVYRYRKLNRETAIYGLIGGSGDKSPGHIYHNNVFGKRHINAVYVKMAVNPEELADFFSLAKKIGVKGLSVTMPLKESVIPFVDELTLKAEKMGAVNTLRFDKGRIVGTNTDGDGALDAIEKKMAVRGKKVVILGAGGAARAIAFEACTRGADVIVLNRTLDRAEKIAESIGCDAGGLEDVPAHYDILINCAPVMPIDPKKIIPKIVAMDVVRTPRDTLFLQEAAHRGCQLVYGEEMFLNQAIAQTTFWLDNG